MAGRLSGRPSATPGTTANAAFAATPPGLVAARNVPGDGPRKLPGRVSGCGSGPVTISAQTGARRRRLD